MAKEIPVFIPEKKLFAQQLNATWQAIAGDVLLGIDQATNKPKSLFNIGDLTEIVGGSMVNDMIVRNDGQINVYDSSALPVDGTYAWVIKGYKKGDKPYILNYIIHYVFMSRSQEDYASSESGTNA